jgi:hypothetical protein
MHDAAELRRAAEFLAGGQPFRAAPDLTEARLKLAGCRIPSVFEGSGF